MAKRILITGGAGFIGSHLADELLGKGYLVRAIDCLSEQVHGPGASRPKYLSPKVELIVANVNDREALRRALDGVDAVYHLAAKVGVGQSMYEIANYTHDNNLATAVLLEELARHRVDRLVVASSMSIYGEGYYETASGKRVLGEERSLEQMRAREWELRDDEGHILSPVPTPESKTPALSSIYALSKYDQERMCLIFGRAYRVPTVALRFFNVYGPRQSLSNPYTGVLAIFAARLLQNKPVTIFEDGGQQRDFVNVADIALACRLALEVPEAADNVFNIGSGQQLTIRDIADHIARLLDKDIEPEITDQYRVGDIRHCFADISLARRVLGYAPRVTFEHGLEELAEWLQSQIVVKSTGDQKKELSARGLTV